MTSFRFRPIAALAAAALISACAKGDQANRAADTTARNLTLAPSETTATMTDRPAAETKTPAAQPKPKATVPARQPAARPAPRPTPPPPATTTVPAGTAIDIAVVDTISSRGNHAGEPFTALVVADAPSAHRPGLPEGAEVHGTIVEVKPAPNPNTPGTLILAITSITINGKDYPVEARIDSLETIRQGRGVTTGDAAKVGAGAAIGAIAGRILGGNKKGTIIGGIVGAAAGAGAAAASKDSDIVLPAGAHVHITLTKPLVVAAR
jgi:hypothetical protein